MTAKPLPAHARRQIERLERLLAAERERAEVAWESYRKALYENVTIKLKLEAIQRAINGETE